MIGFRRLKIVDLRKKLNKMARKLNVRNGKVVSEEKPEEDEEVELDDKR